jgi:branched-chain amino acid transport system ATP-binding protein
VAILTADGIHVAFGGLQALAGVHLSVDAGTIHGLIGPNGSGKTTLCNVISGFYRPRAGRVAFEGRDLATLAPHAVAAAGIARTFQDLQVFGEMTALENVQVGAHSRGQAGILGAVVRTRAARREDAAAREEARAMLAYVGLAGLEDRRANRLSFGQQRMLELARALASCPRLLLLDEPAAGLSPVMVERLTGILRDLRGERGLTIVLIEHVIRLVMGVSDRITVLDHGERIADGPPDAIRRDARVIEAYLGTALDRAAD